VLAERSLALWRERVALLLLCAAGAQRRKNTRSRLRHDCHAPASRKLNSPDARWVAYTIATPDLDANRNATNIWMAPVSGGEAIQLTRTGKDSSPKWSPDGKTLAFSFRAQRRFPGVSAASGRRRSASRHQDFHGPVQICEVVAGRPKRFCSLRPVFPDCKDDACNKKRDQENEKNPVKAHVAEELLYRHWTHW
jgi:hypothetical protein